MKRPLTDFFDDNELYAMSQVHTKCRGLCFDCEEPLGDYHYRLSNSSMNRIVQVCLDCGSALKKAVIKRRYDKGVQPRRHFDPPTAKELQKPNSFTKPGSKKQ